MTKLHSRVPDVGTIAVLRANGLGDFILSLPALEALRAAYPNATITLLGREWHAELLAGRPGPIDRVVPIPVARGVGAPPESAEDPSALARFFAAMAAERFDLAIQMHGGGRYSNPFTRRLGARLTVGLRAPEAEPLDRWLPYVYWQPEIPRYIELVGLVGAPVVTLEPRLRVLERDLAASRAVAPDSPEPLVVLHPGVTDERRRWPAEKFAAVGDALAAAGCRVAITGTPPEAGIAAKVAARMRAPAINACGRLSLSGLVGLLARAALVVSNDSGPRHLAEAVGVPTVGIYWCGNLLNSGPLTRARHRAVASWRLECPVCGLNCLQAQCKHQVSFVAEVAVSDVVTAAMDLLASPPQPVLATAALASQRREWTTF